MERLSYDTVEEIFKQGLHSYLNDIAGPVRFDWRRHRPNLLLLRGGGMNRYRLVHATEFIYDGPVSESYNEVRLRPIHDEKQSCLSFRLTTDSRLARHIAIATPMEIGCISSTFSPNTAA